MKCSIQGRALTKDSEGLVLKVYKDSGGVLTGGWGHTGPGLAFGATVSPAQAAEWFDHDMAIAEASVSRLAGECSQGQFDALCDFVFNLGADRLKNSTLLRKHLAGDHKGAADQFLVWVYCKGQKLPGLVKRRAKERELYLAG